MAIKYFLLIRHGKTRSNLERRYISDPNEPLCQEGIREAEALAHSNVLPPVNRLMAGTALRCRQTAEILFPHINPEICPLTEIDFGLFKGKNADDLIGNRDYEQWLESNCMSHIPKGGSVTAFKERCCESFGKIAESNNAETVALIIHGGNIMAIMEGFALPKQDFYRHHVPNCGFILCRYENGALYVQMKGGGK